jgi:hypothetical protein
MLALPAVSTQIVFRCTVLKKKHLTRPSLGRRNCKLLHIQQFLQSELVARTQDIHISSSSCEFKDSFRPRTLDACTQDLTLEYTSRVARGAWYMLTSRKIKQGLNTYYTWPFMLPLSGLAKQKSANFNIPPFVISIFAGFKSLCRIRRKKT